MSNLKPSTLNDFWANKRVIVTGGAGFLGSFVAEMYFGFRAQVLFEEGLKRTIDWYKEYSG